MENWTPRFKVRLQEIGIDPDAIRRRLTEDGVVVVKGLFTDETLGYVVEGCGAMVDEMLGGIDPSGELAQSVANLPRFQKKYAALKEQRDDLPTVFRQKCHNEDLFDLFFDPNVLDLMTCLLGGGYGAGSETRLLPGYRIVSASDGNETACGKAWHQEYSTGVSTDSDLLPVDSIRNAFGRQSTGGNGAVCCHTFLSGYRDDGPCLEFMEKSHTKGPLVHEINDSGEYFKLNKSILEEIHRDDLNITKVELGPGDVVLYSMFTVKRTVGKYRWHSSWAYQMLTREPILWDGANGFVARSDENCDAEVQSGLEWKALQYSGRLDSNNA